MSELPESLLIFFFFGETCSTQGRKLTGSDRLLTGYVKVYWHLTAIKLL